MATTRPLIRPFQPRDQTEARALLAASFREHFGDAYDEAGDHDLDDVSAMFSNGLFLVAELDGRIVGCGGLVIQDGYRTVRTVRTPDGTAEIQRRTIARQPLRGDVIF